MERVEPSAAARRAASPARCVLCGSSDLLATRYLRLNSTSAVRNLAYAVPRWLAVLLGRVSNRFDTAYRPVQVNRDYFDRQAVYCRACRTGWASPAFQEAELAEYYRSFYWGNRDSIDGHHVPLEDRPNDRQRTMAVERIQWLQTHGARYNSVIDLGAGDCAAAYQFIEDGVGAVHVVDPSERAAALSAKYGGSYSDSMAGAPIVDMVYSAHSLEHVASLRSTLEVIARTVRPGGFAFFETPNIADEHVFLGLCHTPHTFMLSESSFRTAIEGLPFRIVAVEACGPEWRVHYPRIASDARADLRVLLERTAGEAGCAP